MTTFSELGLAAALVRAVEAKGYATPSPIQLQAIPLVRAGRDLLGLAQTGTGKTAAFALPILDRFLAAPKPPEPRACRALVLAPTRELAAQIADSFLAYGAVMGARVAVVFGGVSIGRQVNALSRGVDILVATPGRLLDLVGQRAVRLDRVEALVLDEADHMLDLGFIAPLRKIRGMVPAERQTLLFSATMPKEIAALAAEFLADPVEVSVTPVASTPQRVAQEVAMVSSHAAKQDALEALLKQAAFTRVLVFTRTKHGADKVVKRLEQAHLNANAIHGNKRQPQRERALAAFRSGEAPILVATDIAARGIDVADVSHVINFDLPEVPETYVHRIGRTARAGASGCAITLCAPDELPLLRAAEKLMGLRVPGAPEPSPNEPKNPPPRPQQRQQQRQGQRQGQQRQGQGHGQGSGQKKRQDGHRGRPEPRAEGGQGERRGAGHAGPPKARAWDPTQDDRPAGRGGDKRAGLWSNQGDDQPERPARRRRP